MVVVAHRQEAARARVRRRRVAARGAVAIRGPANVPIMSRFTHEGTENQMRWDRRRSSFMEVWYATLNHRASGCGVWLRYTITAPKQGLGSPYCELWGFVFDPDNKRSFAHKQRFEIDRLGSGSGRDDGALVRIGDAFLTETHLEGEVSGTDGALRWSLDMEPAERCFQHLPSQIRGRIADRVSTVCSPNLSVPFTGTVEVGGDVLEFDGELGAQSHRWGRRHSETWTWAHCAHFEEDPTALFEGVAARAALGPLPGPTMTFLYLEYEGEQLAFNDLKWAMRAKSRYEMPTWAFTARNDEHKIVGAARARPDRLVQVRYQDPDGSARFCANSEIADLAIEVYARGAGGWLHRGSLTSLRTAHLEFGRPDRFAELPVAF